MAAGALMGWRQSCGLGLGLGLTMCAVRVPREALKYLYSYSQRREVSAQIIQAQPAAHLVGNVSHVN